MSKQKNRRNSSSEKNGMCPWLMLHNYKENISTHFASKSVDEFSILGFKMALSLFSNWGDTSQIP